MSEILQFTGKTKLNINPDAVLDGAKGQLKEVIVIGYEGDDTIYFASSNGNKAGILFALETLKFKLMRGDYDADNN